MLIKKLLAAPFLFALVVTSAFTQAQAPAQDANNSKTSTTAAPTQPTLRTYKLDFSINELEEGKRVDSRQYSMVVNNLGRPGDVRAGTRVPAGMKSDGTPQYLDVNTSISANLYNRGGEDAVDVNCNVTSLALGSDTGSQRPVLRTLDITGGTTLAAGKHIILGIADDPNSKHEFQLEMTVTEMK